jgi:hypothetical protein
LDNIIDFEGSDAGFIEIDCTLNKLSTVMCLETTNNALIIWLYVHGKIWLEIFNMNVGES